MEPAQPRQSKFFETGWEIPSGRGHSEYFHGRQIPPGAEPLRLLGVDYLHVKTAEEGDLYVTKYGFPFLDNLKPENWYEREWFEQSREKLLGSSTVYKVRTKEIAGVSKELVVKWCRVGEHVPIDTFTLTKFVEAEFNSPYEEFSLVTEMRESPSPGTIRTHKPLAIYVPAERFKLWQTGRSHSKIAQKKAKYRDVELDIYRQYILIYEWIKGVAITEALANVDLDIEARRAELRRLTELSIEEMRKKGYRVLDMKPEHVIVRPRPDGSFPRDRTGKIPYALVDFELLLRTPEHEEKVKAQRRAEYLKKQRDRFSRPRAEDYPQHLHPMRVFGVDYVFGHSESTGGAVWVVGNDPGLFDYFQPERWRRTPRTQLSQSNQVFYTLTKDKIHLVWKVSRVGEVPDVEAGAKDGETVLRFGFNSPFEEFALALELGRRGVATTYPRAIYMTGQESLNPDDLSRYETHAPILSPDGKPVLRFDHNYITIWGYWNGSDEVLARQDAGYCKGLNALQARELGLIDEERVRRLTLKVEVELNRAGMEDLDPKPTHFLVTQTPDGTLLRDDDGLPSVRICNFETIRMIDREETDRL